MPAFHCFTSASVKVNLLHFRRPVKLTKAELKRIRQIEKDFEYIVFGEPIKIFVGIESKILANEKTAGKIKFQTNSYELVWTDFGEKGFLVTKLHFFIKISSMNEKNDRCFEEIIRINLKEGEVKKDGPILFQTVFELPKGNYTLFFLVRDIESGKTGTNSINFEVK